MRIGLNVVAVLLIVMGSIWFLQGIGVLLGSFMSGETQWEFYGAITALAGVALAVFANRRR
jgi:hypothetical protein